MHSVAMMMHAYMAAVVVLLGAIVLLMPRLTRPDIWFSVTVDRAFRDTEEGRRILRAYRLFVAVFAIAALAIVAAGMAVPSTMLSTASVFVLIVGYTAAFLQARRRTLPYAAAPSTVREAELRRGRTSLPGGVVLQSGPFAILLAAAAWIGTQWDRLPARIPTHWNMSGVADAWAARSPAAVFATTAVGLVMCALVLLLSYGLLRRSRRVHAAGAKGEAEQHFRLTTLAVLLGAEYLVAVNFAVITVLPLLRRPGTPLVAITLLGLLFVIATIVVLARAGQGGARLAPAENGEKPVGDRTADAFWKWGIFYVNRADPVLFVEKRFGIGYTVNLGNPWCWVLLVALIAVPVAVSLALKLSSS